MSNDMENRNLGDFFRKKIHSDETSDWLKPDMEVRNSVLENIMVQPETQKPNKRKFYSLLPFFIILFLMGLSTYFYSENKDLKSQLETQKNDYSKKINNLDENVKNLHSDYNKKQKSLQSKIVLLQEEKEHISILLENEKKNKENNIVENKPVIVYNTVSDVVTGNEKEIQQQNQIISELQTLVSDLENQLSHAKYNLAQCQKNGTDEHAQITALPQVEWSVDYNKNKRKIYSSPQIAASKRKKFEFGLDYAIQQMNYSTIRTFENQRIASDNSISNLFRMHSKGLSVGYSPVRNWWIRTGIRYDNHQIYNQFKMGLAYDPTNEVSDGSGLTTNNIRMTTDNNYAQGVHEMRLAFEQGTELEEGDLLEMTIDEGVLIRYTQIPVSIQYRLGKNKWQWLFQGGAQWNRLRFQDYTFFTNFTAKGEEIPLVGDDLFELKLPSRNYWSAQAGVGLNYQILDHLNAQATINYNYDFIQFERETSNNSKSRALFQIGLNFGL